MHLILRQLDQQWSELASSPEARRAVKRWSSKYLILKDMVDLADVLRSRHDETSGSAVQLALAALAPTDDLAARALLQMLLPGIIRAAAATGYDNPDAVDEFVPLAWERIRTYPSTRSGSVSANVVLDVRKRYLQAHLGDRTVSIDVVREVPSTTNAPEEQALVALQVEELRDARDRGVVSAGAFEAIVLTRAEGYSIAEVAEQSNLPANAVYQRRWRAEQRLRELQTAA